ncbi:MAG TPA: nodulation protein NfeD [Nitrospirae bacterium]|nr:nodulation protein NfeD [Nitrospirota bacterium]
MKKIALFIVFTAFLSLTTAALSYADIIVIRASGVVNPVMAEFISNNLDNAAAEKADVLVVELDTPGGLDASMRIIIKKIIASEVPVVVYVSPSGARAASAGVFITISAHIAAMAGSTNIGAAHPVSMGGKMDDTLAEKAVNDAAAYIRSLADERGRNPEWAEKAVRESVSITQAEALELNVIDLVAEDLASLLSAIDGRKVTTSSGEQIIVTKNRNVIHKEMGLRLKILNIISDPNIAYILMLLGFYGILYELTNPGAVVPGVVGAISLILAFYSLQTLPVNYAGLLLIILAIILFVLEIKVTSYGVLTIGGITAMLVGSLMLFESSQPFFRVSLFVILPAVVLTALFFSIIVALAVKAYRRKPSTGMEGLIGLEGETRTDVHEKGQVFVHGEIWSARSGILIKSGEKIIVEKVEGLKLKIRQLKIDD